MTNPIEPPSSEEINTLIQITRKLTGNEISAKHPELIKTRLEPRIRHYRFTSYSSYIDLLLQDTCSEETQPFIDAMTTNESYFFREPLQFDFLLESVLPSLNLTSGVDVWCAAASEGQEAYSLAMSLDNYDRPFNWTLLASDVNRSVIDKARKGLYPMIKLQHMPHDFLKTYCKKGTGPYQGHFLINQALKDKLSFSLINLNSELPPSGQYDLVFLRNVLIYFNSTLKQEVIDRVSSKLKPGGYLFLSVTESIDQAAFGFELMAPGIYRKLADIRRDG